MFIREIKTGYGIQPPASLGSALPYHDGTLMWDNSNRSVRCVTPTSTSASYYPQDVFIQLDQPTIDVVEWAKKKMAEERKVLELTANHPEIKNIWDQYQLLVTLASNNGI